MNQFTPPRGLIDLSNDVYCYQPEGMRERIAHAHIAEGIYGDDQSALAFERRIASVLGKASALYFLTGTAANLVAHMTHCAPGDEVICGQYAHTFNLEGGGAQRVAGLSVRTVPQVGAALDLEAVRTSIRSGEITQPVSRLLWIDQPSRGYVLPLATLRDLCELAWAHELKVHIDGARLFEAAVALGVDVRELVDCCDSVMVSFTKGLCAPAGAVLAGPREFIERTRRNRKVIGAEIRQAGYMVAAAEFAMDEMVSRLRDDRTNAQRLAAAIRAIPHLTLDRAEVESNRFVMIVNSPLDPSLLVASVRPKGVFLNAPRPPYRGINIVTHYGVDASMIDAAIVAIREAVLEQLGNSTENDQVPLRTASA